MTAWAKVKVAAVVIVLLLANRPVASAADIDGSPPVVAVVDLQKVLAAIAQMHRPSGVPATGPQQGERATPQNGQTRSAFRPFTSALQAVAELAPSRGCDVVLSIRTGARPCFVDKSLDLTDEVIARLDARTRHLEQPLPAAATRPAGRVTIAAVNVAHLLNQMGHTRELQAVADGQRQRRALEQENQERMSKISVLKGQRDQAAKGSPERKDLDAKLMDAAVALEKWQKSAQRDVERDERDQYAGMKAPYEEIATAAAELGRRRGCWLVLQAARLDIPEDLGALRPDQLRLLMESATVLYTAPQADLTNELLQILNAQHAGAVVPWPATRPSSAGPLPVRIVDQAEVSKRTGLSPSQFGVALSQLALRRGYTLVLPQIRPKLPDSVNGADPDALRNLMTSCNVLYADPAADIGAELK